MAIERRTLLKVLSAGAATPEALLRAANQCSVTGAGTSYENYRFVFLDSDTASSYFAPPVGLSDTGMRMA